jgi:hypothetical protein
MSDDSQIISVMVVGCAAQRIKFFIRISQRTSAMQVTLML